MLSKCQYYCLVVTVATPALFLLIRLIVCISDSVGVNRLCQFKRSVDMEPGFYELQYVIRARAVAMLDKYDKDLAQEGSAKDGITNTDAETTPTQLSSDGETTPTQSLDDEAVDSQEVNLSESADVAAPTENGDQPSGAGNSYDVMKEELDRILELCGDNLKQQLGPAGYYCVHQKLMEKVMTSLRKWVWLHRMCLLSVAD